MNQIINDDCIDVDFPLESLKSTSIIPTGDQCLIIPLKWKQERMEQTSSGLVIPAKNKMDYSRNALRFGVILQLPVYNSENPEIVSIYKNYIDCENGFKVGDFVAMHASASVEIVLYYQYLLNKTASLIKIPNLKSEILQDIYDQIKIKYGIDLNVINNQSFANK